MKINGYTLSSGRFCQATTSGMGQDLVLHAVCISVVLPDDFRLKAAVTVTGHLDVDLSQLGFHLLLGIAIAVASGLFSLSRSRALASLATEFLVHLYFHHLLNDVPEHLFCCIFLTI